MQRISFAALRKPLMPNVEKPNQNGQAEMKQIHANYVSVSDTDTATDIDSEYFQVVFEENEELGSAYVLLQRQFEIPDGVSAILSAMRWISQVNTSSDAPASRAIACCCSYPPMQEVSGRLRSTLVMNSMRL